MQKLRIFVYSETNFKTLVILFQYNSNPCGCKGLSETKYETLFVSSL